MLGGGEGWGFFFGEGRGGLWGGCNGSGGLAGEMVVDRWGWGGRDGSIFY